MARATQASGAIKRYPKLTKKIEIMKITEKIKRKIWIIRIKELTLQTFTRGGVLKGSRKVRRGLEATTGADWL